MFLSVATVGSRPEVVQSRFFQWEAFGSQTRFVRIGQASQSKKEPMRPPWSCPLAGSVLVIPGEPPERWTNARVHTRGKPQTGIHLRNGRLERVPWKRGVMRSANRRVSRVESMLS